MPYAPAGQGGTPGGPSFTLPINIVPGGPAPSQSAPAQPAAPAAPPTIPLTVEEYQRLRSLESQLDEFRKAQQSALDAKEAERLKALAEKGNVEQAFEEHRKSWEAKLAEKTTQYATLEGQVFAERKTAVLADAFNGRNFVGETPEQKAATAAMVKRLLADEFETTRDASGSLVVREKVTGRPAADVLKEKLDSPAFAIFFAPTSRGGTGADPNRPNPNPNPNQPQPGSLESIVSNWKQSQGQYQSFGLRGTR